MSGMAEVLEELWEQGNCAGLDGWIGLGRGQRNFDEEAVSIRRRDVEKALTALSAAGFGPVKEAAAVALEEAADDIRTSSDCGNHYNPSACETCSAVAVLRDRAAVVRGEGG